MIKQSVPLIKHVLLLIHAYVCLFYNNHNSVCIYCIPAECLNIIVGARFNTKTDKSVLSNLIRTFSYHPNDLAKNVISCFVFY